MYTYTVADSDDNTDPSTDERTLPVSILVNAEGTPVYENADEFTAMVDGNYRAEFDVTEGTVTVNVAGFFAATHGAGGAARPRR